MIPSKSGRRAAAICTALLLAAAACGGAPSALRSSAVPPSPVAPSAAATPPPVAATPSPPVSTTVAAIERLRAAVSVDPADAEAQRDLGLALSQRVRETADPSLYERALAAFGAARRLAPDDARTLVGIAGVQLGKHEFADALVTAEDAIERSPSLVAAHAARVDALVELGRYDEADAAAGVMLGLAADLSTLARVSYLAELHGRLPAALAAMRQAAASPGLAPENSAYVSALVGNLLVATGDQAAAAEAYQAGLALVPDHAPSLAGLGRLAVGAGRLEEAIARFERAAVVVPLPEYVLALGDAQEAAGRTAAAERSFDLARAEIQLFRAAGVVVDVDLSLFEADHGDSAAALRDAIAAYDAAPTIRAADARAWALHRLGRDRAAMPFVEEALRLGSRDALLRYHAGAIEAALGHVTTARRDLELALATDGGFSATGADEARRLLETLGAAPPDPQTGSREGFRTGGPSAWPPPGSSRRR